MTKFKQGDKVLHDGEEKTIEVSRKNFSNQSIVYKLDTGEQVEEKDLKPAGKSKLARKKKPVQPTKEEIKLQERMEKVHEYAEVFAEGDLENPEFIQNVQEMTNRNFEKYMDTLIEKAIEIEENTED